VLNRGEATNALKRLIYTGRVANCRLNRLPRVDYLWRRFAGHQYICRLRLCAGESPDDWLAFAQSRKIAELAMRLYMA
jgi:hypothetical protein